MPRSFSNVIQKCLIVILNTQLLEYAIPTSNAAVQCTSLYYKNSGWQYLENEKSFWRSAGGKTAGFFRALKISQKIDLGIWALGIFGFLDPLAISQKTKRATGDLLEVF